MERIKSDRGSVLVAAIDADGFERIGPDGYPTHTAGAEQLDSARGDWVGAYDERPTSAPLTALYGPVFPTRPYDATLAPERLARARRAGVGPIAPDRVRTLPGERAADVAAIDKAATAWLRARCDEDLRVLDVRREVTARNGVDSTWQYPLVMADKVAYLGAPRVVVRSHRYTRDKATGSLVTYAIGRGYRFVGHTVERGIAETSSKRRDQRRKAERQASRTGALGTRGKAVTAMEAGASTVRRTYATASPEVKANAATLESVLRTSATGASVTLAPGLTVTVHAATVDAEGRSFPIREFARRAALQGVTVD